MDVAFSINPLGLEGLGATLVSLLRHCSKPKTLRLWFFCSDCTEVHKKAIRSLLHRQKFEGSIEFKDFDAKAEFGHLRSLHGDWSSYGRLLLPEHVPADRVLYLDSDLVVLVDILDLADIDLGEHYLAASGGGQFRYAMEHAFLIGRLKIEPDAAYFNAGVLLFNLAEWRAKNLQQEWKALAKQYPTEWLAVDQTILNAMCRGRFLQLPITYNNAWYPGTNRPADAEDSILHFVGSPKPWDHFGRTLHSGYGIWKQYHPDGWTHQAQVTIWDKAVRTWRIKNSIALKLKAKWLAKA